MPAPGPPPIDAATAVATTYRWFENNSGWAPPDTLTLVEWMSDNVCRCPDECLVVPTAPCEHGLASWWTVLTFIRRAGGGRPWDPALMIPAASRFDLRRPGALAVMEAHERAAAAGDAGYIDPDTGLFVMTAPSLWTRGCCGNGCRHCPFVVG